MTPNKKVDLLNLNQLVIDVEEVIKNGLGTIIGSYMDRYELLENTHKQIMALPSVREELNNSSASNYNIDQPNYNNQYLTSLQLLEYRIEKLENKHDNIIDVLDKILNKIIDLDKNIKSSENIYPGNLSIHNQPEKENIKIHFEESGKQFVEKELAETILKEIDDEETEDEDEETEDEETEDEDEETEDEDQETKDEDQETKDEDQETKDEDQETKDEEITSSTITLNVETDKTSEDKEITLSSVNLSHCKEENDLVVETDTRDTIIDDNIEENASIETETKTETEEEEEEEEEKEEEEEETTPDPNVDNETKTEYVKPVVEEKQTPEEDDDEEIFEIEIDDKTYCTNDDQNGFIWELTDDCEQGDKIGYLKDGDAYFYEDEK